MAYNIAGETLALTDDNDKDDELQRRLITTLSILIFVGAEQSCYECSEHWQTRRRYLIHSDLLPNPCLNTPWQALYSGQNNCAFITTMGIDVPMFHYIFSHGFVTLWESLPSPAMIFLSLLTLVLIDSLDAASALGLILHWLNSTMQEVSLMQIFVLIPTSCVWINNVCVQMVGINQI
jgi:hypothetical protein